MSRARSAMQEKKRSFFVVINSTFSHLPVLSYKLTSPALYSSGVLSLSNFCFIIETSCPRLDVSVTFSIFRLLQLNESSISVSFHMSLFSLLLPVLSLAPSFCWVYSSHALNTPFLLVHLRISVLSNTRVCTEVGRRAPGFLPGIPTVTNIPPS